MPLLTDVPAFSEDTFNLYPDDSYRKQIILYFVFIFVLIVPFLLSYLFLTNASEFDNYPAIVKKQQEHNAIFGSAINTYYYPYKLEMVRVRKPDIISLGSSRAGGFQEEAFTGKFTNAGLAMLTPEQGILFLQDMLKFHKPKAIILTLDYWWFNENWVPSNVVGIKTDEGKITSSKLLKPFSYILQNKLSLSDFLRVAFLQDTHNPYTSYENMGIMAIKTSGGVRKDGSVFYGDYALAGKSDYDPKFQRTLEFIRTAASHYEWGKNLSPARIKELDEIVKICQNNNIQLYLVIPPVSQTVYKTFEKLSPKYEYVNQMRKYLASYKVHVNDFHNPDSLSATDCDFTDGYHSADITYMKMLLQMSQDPKNIGLKPYLNAGAIKDMIRRYNGNLLIKPKKVSFYTTEKDFMKIGCKRSQ